MSISDENQIGISLSDMHRTIPKWYHKKEKNIYEKLNLFTFAEEVLLKRHHNLLYSKKENSKKKSADGIYSHRRLFAVGLLVILLPVVVIFRVLNFFLDSLQTLVTNVYIFGYLLGEFTYQDQRNCKPAAPLTNMG